eukprot:CAMPEP_0115887632 /NCGR_PEP_ID=MMETSP0287-20121206/31860_1 /TAXON_ID=412157 /ORGANISM="Chrysochromulina rotalis, Strain UIO044" /LENGTH=122 /DNA_ID=CAMNT_0003344227 /DNA_START=152 /DNA_END=520 /DNA_ORIENTATION=-
MTERMVSSYAKRHWCRSPAKTSCDFVSHGVSGRLAEVALTMPAARLHARRCSARTLGVTLITRSMSCSAREEPIALSPPCTIEGERTLLQLARAKIDGACAAAFCMNWQPSSRRWLQSLVQF